MRSPRIKSRLLGFLLLFALVVIGGAGWYWYTHVRIASLLSPFMRDLDDTPPLSSLDSPQYIVYGFVPYWNLTKTIVQPEITHLAYFSLPISEEGHLDGITSPVSDDPDADISSRRWRSAQLDRVVNELRPNQKLTITLTQFDTEVIENFLGSTQAQDTFQADMKSFLETTTRPVSGVNVDIEYAGEASPELRQQYVEFIKRTRQTLDTYAKSAGKQPLQLSMSVFASAASRHLLWDLPALTPYIDQTVVMAYDFHRPSSPVAGPVAPLFGAKNVWDNDVVLHLREFLEVMPAEKILLGVPFYGYEWETTETENPRALSFPGTGGTASYGRVQQLLQDPEYFPITQGWDEEALSPYLVYFKDGRQHVIYYEDAKSLGYKLELVTGLRLGGIAIWALGYEDGSRELWDAIDQYLAE